MTVPRLRLFVEWLVLIALACLTLTYIVLPVLGTLPASVVLGFTPIAPVFRRGTVALLAQQPVF